MKPGAVSGLLIPVVSNGSSIQGFTIGEQVYWAINRSMDMVVGTEYYSKRGWAPNGDFRYKGPGLDHLIARWNALLDRGVEEQIGNTGQLEQRQSVRGIARRPVGYELVNQGGVDVSRRGPQGSFAGHARRRCRGVSVELRLPAGLRRQLLAGHQLRRWRATWSLTHKRNGRIPSVWLDRFQSFASTTNGDEVKILHLPMLRYDVLDRPLGSSPLYWGLGSSLGYLNRSEPFFHSRNVGRLGLLSASLHAVHGGRMELRSRGGGSRHRLHHQPDSNL